MPLVAPMQLFGSLCLGVSDLEVRLFISPKFPHGQVLTLSNLHSLTSWDIPGCSPML
jgi:hypothetical protein